MSRVERPGPRRENPQEARIRAVVDSLVSDDSASDVYVQFARELMLAQRRSQRPDNSERRMQKPGCGVAGYTPELVKRVVTKWFRRGLSGHLLWLIGEELMPKPEVFHG
jgi:hypothetical protein